MTGRTMFYIGIALIASGLLLALYLFLTSSKKGNRVVQEILKDYE